MSARRPPAPRAATPGAGRAAGGGRPAPRTSGSRPPRSNEARASAPRSDEATSSAPEARRARLGLRARVPWLQRLPGLTVGAGLVLACVLFGLVSVFAPLRSWVAQQGELADLREDVAAREARVQDLQAQVDRWDDPAYVSAQARTRLHYVLPGETAYVVVDPPAGALPQAEPVPEVEEESWLEGLWRTVRGDSGTLEDGVLEDSAEQRS